MNWKGKPPKASREQVAYIRAIYAARAAIPTNRQLADEFGINKRLVEYYGKRPPKRYEYGE